MLALLSKSQCSEMPHIDIRLVFNSFSKYGMAVIKPVALYESRRRSMLFRERAAAVCFVSKTTHVFLALNLWAA